MDLGHLAGEVAKGARSASLKSVAGRLVEAIDASVIAKALGSKNAAARGLSVWLPSDRGEAPDADKLAAYGRLASSQASGWGGFLGTWLGGVAANTEAPALELVSTANLEGPTGQAPATVTFSVSGDDVSELFSSVGRPAPGGRYNLYGDLFYEEGDAGEYAAEWDGRWITVTDGERRDLFTGFFQNPGDTLLVASARYTPPGEREAYGVSVVLDAETLELASVLDTSGAAPRQVPVAPGGRLAFDYLQFAEANDEAELVSTGSFVVIPQGGLAGLRAGRAALPPGQYTVQVGVVDWAGNEEGLEIPVTVR